MDFPNSVKGYELKELAGAGGFGAVYRAFQPIVERDVAIKIILPQYANEPDFIRQFEVEAQLVARLEHLHIVALYDYWRDPQGAYLVMRWLPGGNLRDWMMKEQLDLPTISRIIDQISAALAFAHRNNVVHQDIKPENILVDEEKNVYLTDFGIAKRLQDEKVKDLHRKTFGSPAYISPEAVMQKETSTQSDIYSLGIVLYELLTGQLPFTGTTETEIMQKHVIASVPSVIIKQAELSPDYDQIIWKATAKQRELRYKTAIELAEDFRRIVSSDGDHPQLDNQTSAQHGLGTLQITPNVTPDITPAFIATVDFGEQLAPSNPYKGLRPFEETDADTFFGRETLVNRLLTQLQNANFLALVGPSGSGKSSVVKAGVIPSIRVGKVESADHWFIATMVPGSHPIQELTEALLSVATDNDAVAFDPEFKDEKRLSRITQQLYKDSQSTILLFIDQFEEIFTLVEDEAERRYFLNNIAYAVNDPECNLRIILTLRADLYDRPLLYADFGQLIQQHTEVILPLSPNELEHTITNPAQKVGVEIHRDLVVQIIADVMEQPGALPLLQYTLTELFDKRSDDVIPLDDYLATGGISGTLASRADDIYKALDQSDQPLARQILLSLISLNENAEPTRRRVLQQDLIAIHKDKEAVQRVLDTFNRNRIMTYDREPVTRAPTVELAHEALIREWQSLKTWINDSRDMLRTQRQLSIATQEWVKSDRDPSFLARGLRLGQYEQLLTSSDVPIADIDREYIEASTALRQRFARRVQMVIAALAILTIVAVGFGIFALDRQNEAVERQNEAVSERDRANEQVRISRSRELAVNALINIDKTDLSLLLSLEALNANDTFEAQNSLLTALYTDSRLQQFLGNHQELVRSLDVSSDGRYVISGSVDNTVILWDIVEGKIIGNPLEGHLGAVNTVAFSPDGNWIASGGDDNILRLWDVESGELIHELSGHTDAIWSVAFNPIGSLVASGSADGTIWLWDVESGEPISNPLINAEDDQEKGAIVHSVVFSRNGQFIATGGEDNIIRLWRAESGDLLGTLEGHQNWVLSLAFNTDGTRLASAGVEPTIIIWNLQTGQAELTINTGHTNWIRDITFNPDDSMVITASVDQSIRFWDASTGESALLPMITSDAVWGTAFSPDGKTLVTNSGNHILAWSIQPTSHVIQANHQSGLNDIAISPDGELLATASGRVTGTSDNTARLWNQDGEEIGLIDAHRGPVTSVVFHPNLPLLVTASSDQTAVIWDYSLPDDIQLVHVLRHNNLVWRAIFSPDGNILATGAEDGQIILWDVGNGSPIGDPIDAHESGVLSLAFNANGTLLASGGADNAVHIWNVANGSLQKSFLEHTSFVVSLTFSPDGKTLATASRDNTIRLWNMDNETSRILAGHTNWVNDIDFNPEGTLLASVSRDETVILWDLATYQPLGIPIKGHGDWIIGTNFSNDGKMLLSTDENGEILFWDVDMGIWRQHACEIANRNFSSTEWEQFFPDTTFHEICLAS